MQTRIEIVDAALISIGAQPLQSETARGAPSRLIEYDTILLAQLAGYPWTFATRTRKLARQTGTVPTHYKYAYVLPSDMLGGPRAAYDTAETRLPFHDWDIRSEDASKPAVLATDAIAVWLRFTVNVAPQFWPGYFTNLMIRACAAQFAASVREDAALAERLKAEVYGAGMLAGDGGIVGYARACDAQSKPALPMTMGYNPLVDVRR